jgi:hypothetical protein
MSEQQLREFISITLQQLGGRDAALVALRNDPGNWIGVQSSKYLSEEFLNHMNHL